MKNIEILYYLKFLLAKISGFIINTFFFIIFLLK